MRAPTCWPCGECSTTNIDVQVMSKRLHDDHTSLEREFNCRGRRLTPSPAHKRREVEAASQTKHPKRLLVQQHLDFGQTVSSGTVCSKCGLLYSLVEADIKVHEKFCRLSTPQEERNTDENAEKRWSQQVLSLSQLELSATNLAPSTRAAGAPSSRSVVAAQHAVVKLLAAKAKAAASSNRAAGSSSSSGDHTDWQVEKLSFPPPTPLPCDFYFLRCGSLETLEVALPPLVTSLAAAATTVLVEPLLEQRTWSAAPPRSQANHLVLFIACQSRFVGLIGGRMSRREQEPQLHIVQSALRGLQRHHTLGDVDYLWTLPDCEWQRLAKEPAAKAPVAKRTSKTTRQLACSELSLTDLFAANPLGSKEGRDWARDGCMAAALQCWCQHLIYGVPLAPRSQLSFREGLVAGPDAHSIAVQDVRRWCAREQRQGEEEDSWEPFVHRSFIKDDTSEDDRLSSVSGQSNNEAP